MSNFTQEQFDAKLEELVGQMSVSELMALPGFYEIVSESLNNEILRELEDESEDDEDDEDDEADVMPEDQAWQIVAEVCWASDYGYRRILRFLMEKYSLAEMQQYEARLRLLKATLQHTIEEYEERTNRRLDLGDDSYDDLTWHIIGLGKDAYEAHLGNMDKVFEMARKNSYRESFGYTIPHEYDYRAIVRETYVQQAKDLIGHIERYVPPCRSRDEAIKALKYVSELNRFEEFEKYQLADEIVSLIHETRSPQGLANRVKNLASNIREYLL